jgi:hypothetical protein
MADILRLQTDVPEVIALKFTEGQAATSQYGGDQLMFSLCDGRITFLPPFVGQKIAESGIQPNQPFEICKRAVTRGNRRTVEYQMAAVSNGNGHSNGKGNGHTNGLHAVPTATPAAAMPSQPMPSHEEAVRLLAAYAPAASAAPTEVRPADSSAVEFMKLAGRGAIDAVVDVEGYARSRGLAEFVFDSLSVQKIMVSLYIDLRKGGRA